jgi:hypothetical protein
MLESNEEETSYMFIGDVRLRGQRDKATAKWCDNRSMAELSGYKTVERLLQENFPNRDVRVQKPEKARHVKSARPLRDWRLITTVCFHIKNK